jgi:hypothetical protein
MLDLRSTSCNLVHIRDFEVVKCDCAHSTGPVIAVLVALITAISPVRGVGRLAHFRLGCIARHCVASAGLMR